MFNGQCNNEAPFGLRPFDCSREISIEQKIVQFRVALICFDDSIQESCANDAAASPDRGDIAEVEVPLIFSASGAQKLHSLRVRNNLRRVKCIAHRIDQASAIPFKLSKSRVWQNFRGSYAFVLSG